jgi:hypothetical protein
MEALMHVCGGNYEKAIEDALRRAALPQGAMVKVIVAHDPWCAMLHGAGPCDCAPDVVVERVVFQPMGSA